MIRAFELQDEIDKLQNLDSYDIPNEHDPETEDPNQLLEAVVEAVAEQSERIRDEEVFDIYRSLLKHSSSVPGAIMTKLLDSLLSGLQSEVEAASHAMDDGDQQALGEHKITLEIFAFLIQWFVLAAENVKAPGEGDVLASPAAAKSRRGKGAKAGKNTKPAAAKPEAEAPSLADMIPSILGGLSKVLKLKLQKIWTTPPDRDPFVSCITWPAYHICEKEAYMKSKTIRLPIYKLLCNAVRNHGHGQFAHARIMQSLQFHEHLAEPWSDFLAILYREYDYPQLADEVLVSISGLSFTSSTQDIKSCRSFSKFLLAFSQSVPKLAYKQISLLQGHLDSEAYPMRMALVEIIGIIIKALTEDGEMNVEKEQAQRQIERLFDALIDRLLDVSTYVRCKVAAVLTKLCEARQKYTKQRMDITAAAIAALEDKTASVRKNVLALLTQLAQTHPWCIDAFSKGLLDQAMWEEKYKFFSARLNEIDEVIGKAVEDPQRNSDSDDEEKDEEEDQDAKQAKDEEAMDVDNDTQSEEGDEDMESTNRRKSKIRRRKSEPDMQAVAKEQEAVARLNSEEYKHFKASKDYCSGALSFIRQLNEASEIACQLLGSTHKAEILEAIEFFNTLHQLEFAGAEKGVKQMLHLIWYKDNTSTSEDEKVLKGVRQRLLECYRTLYFDPDSALSPQKRIDEITKNMIQLTSDATLAELTSLEEMMRAMMDDGSISSDVIDRLWTVYSADRAIPKRQRRGAIVILGMLALAKREVVTDKVDILLKIGLGACGKADLMLARYTCTALQRLDGSVKKVKGSLEDKTIRLDMSNLIFSKIQAVIEQPCKSKDWFGLAEQAINTIYALGDHPDVLCRDIIKRLTARVFAARKQPNASEEKPEDAMEEDPPLETQETDAADAPSSTTGSDTADAFELSKLLFVVGHVAIKQIVYLELVEREWKRQKDEKAAAEKARNGRMAAPKEVEELDQVAGNAEDEIGERIATVRETELLYGEQSLLALYGPMIVHICGSPHKFKNSILRAAAVLAFSKFLCVSAQFCDHNHRLLFKILETSKHADIRSNIVIALGDVAVSFSTIIDENSNELYKGLSDKEPVVKKNTLMVLTHLILNGMVKVKGQLGEMAKCVEDPERRISDLAKLFFSELSTKENAIYNNLPDVISHLSVGEHSVDEEKFQNTLKFIFKFIEKEKQAESIVEKLCERFRRSEDPRQWRDIAFCLSLLPFKSERSMKKLIEGLQFYQDKLDEPVVFSRFQEILTKAQSNKAKDKPDTELNEFRQILENHKARGEEDKALEKRAQNKKAAVKKRATRQSARKRAQAEEE